MDRQALIESARAMIGTPFKHEGRSIRGVDCYGMFIVLGIEHGIPVPIETGYGKRPSGLHMKRMLELYANNVQRSEIQSGDILHIKFNDEPQHLALVSSTDPLMIIHADAIAGRVVEHRLDKEWMSKVRGAYRVEN